MPNIDPATLPLLTTFTNETLYPRPRGVTTGSGLQDAHMLGAAFWNRWLYWLSMLESGSGAGGATMQSSAAWNLAQLPETEFGQAILRAGVHWGRHVDAFNKIAYSGDETNPRFLDKIKSQFNNGTKSASELRKLRLEVMAFSDTMKLLTLDQGLLDRIGIKGLHSLALRAFFERLESE